MSVDYRLTSVKDDTKTKYPFPAQVHDVKCAVRWLRANAEKYMIDPAHMVTVGSPPITLVTGMACPLAQYLLFRIEAKLLWAYGVTTRRFLE